MFFRLCRFLHRWSAREGSSGPLIVSAYPDGFSYLALRLRAGNKIMWIRAAQRDHSRIRWSRTRIIDLRGRFCECGSGLRVASDMDGCGDPGCWEYHFRVAQDQGQTA